MKVRALGAVLVGGMIALTGCGSTSTGGASGPVGVSQLCKQTVAKPGYNNDIKLTGGATSLSGAGSTFINPAMSVWTDAYKTANSVQVAYQSVGSGAGIAQIQEKTVDFGASDAYMSDADIGNAKGGAILQVPLVLAPVVIVYNLPNIKSGIQFDGETIGKIFAGKITSWNDPALTALNNDKNLPNTPIAVAHRSDGSGTTDIFTDYLTKESPTWVTALGGDKTKSRGKTVAWPVGIGGKGNEGVSGAVNQTQGGIGYVELGYAVQQNLSYGNVKNKSGNYIEPCIATVTAATNGVSYPDDLRFDLTDGSDQAAYPITGTTWAMLYQNQTDKAKGTALVNFLSWTLSDGQDKLGDINYAPLGKELRTKAVGQLKKVASGGTPLAP